MKIGEILLKYETDKNKGTISPELGHCYGNSYQKIFDRFGKESEISILEIGVQKGGSLLAWKEYFKKSHVVGIDISDTRLEKYKKNSVNFILSSITDESLKDNPLIKDQMFDIIIDDGSHFLGDVIYVVRNFLKNLKPGGYLIIEDAQNPEEWISRIIPSIDTSIYNIFGEDLRKINGTYDDYLIIIGYK